MKKLVFTSLCVVFFSVMSFAQTPQVAAEPQTGSQISKEDKKAMKAKKESDVQEALTGAGLTADEVKAANAIMAASSKKSKELKENDKLTVEEKDAAKKAINEDKNAKLKELMGADKHKTYNALKKKLKEEKQD